MGRHDGRGLTLPRSLVTVDLGAIRHNVRVLRERVGGSEVWAVVKADAYGHGAVPVARAAVEAGATALLAATVGEAVALREALADARIIVLGPAGTDEVRVAREARLELCVSSAEIPEGPAVHVKLDTGMGRWGLAELPAACVESTQATGARVGGGVVGVMSHFASSESDAAFTQEQLERFVRATGPYPHLTRHIANSAAALRIPASRLDAVRCGIALYGISPFGADPADDGLRPALRWESTVALVKTLASGESTGYNRRFTAAGPTRIGIVPVGYADGFRRDLTGTHVVVAGERAPVAGTVSMDALAVLLPAGAGEDDPVTLIGPGAPIEEHARVAGTIGYEIACGIRARDERAERAYLDG